MLSKPNDKACGAGPAEAGGHQLRYGFTIVHTTDRFVK